MYIDRRNVKTAAESAAPADEYVLTHKAAFESKCLRCCCMFKPGATKIQNRSAWPQHCCSLSLQVFPLPLHELKIFFILMIKRDLRSVFPGCDSDAVSLEKQAKNSFIQHSAN